MQNSINDTMASKTNGMARYGFIGYARPARTAPATTPINVSSPNRLENLIFNFWCLPGIRYSYRYLNFTASPPVIL
ncbi:hypothetical protein RCIX2613 [Methanocella arvoryzae MRE50]|uniref:Uncharacterized protein n=1 Tax=Methanocella arvoryzae (strain DSM 22066 / NBRC 105507 / MRE50) TaxID=351160 RepID=Q0W1T0_METAR|nr:hypothetical protein RCIX2613 [Methanocella arvoryzae MRE50]